MKYTVLIGNIMRCNQSKLSRENVYSQCVQNLATQKQGVLEDTFVKQAVLIEALNAEFIDVDELIDASDWFIRAIEDDTIWFEPKEVGDYYIDEDSVKTFYSNKKVKTTIKKIKNDVELLKKQQPKVLGQYQINR